MKERFIIGPHAGGVGDNLAYSWLPEDESEKAQAEGREVEILIGVGGLNPQWRNSEAYDLIWGRNPHVSGFTDEPPNAGVHVIAGAIIGESKRQRGIIPAIEQLHGFAPKHRVPKLYYEPKLRMDVRQKVLISPTAISCPVPDAAIEKFVKEIGRWHGFDPADVVVLTSKHDGPYGQKALRGNERLPVADIYEYVDLVHSCATFLTSESGGNSIAAAVREPWTTHALCSLWTFNDKLWLFDGITYRTDKSIPLDGSYHPYPEENRPIGVWGEVRVR